MARKTIGAIINITGFPFMICIHRSFITMCVAKQTVKYRIIGGISMTFTTQSPLSLMFTAIYREKLCIMIISRRCPSVLCMTSKTGSWELGSCMCRVRCSIVFSYMTTITISGNSDITFRVATDAAYANMCANYGESGTGSMIKCRWLPGR